VAQPAEEDASGRRELYNFSISNNRTFIKMLARMNGQTQKGTEKQQQQQQ
jgi:hypothetical protein